jgi:hypothetical protein
LSFIRSSLIVPFAVILVITLFWFRPGGVEGPRASEIPATGKSFDHSVFTRVLKKIVKSDGTVDYPALKADTKDLDRYLGQLGATSPGNAPHRFRKTQDRLAYYLNAYNAFVLAAVRDHCPMTNVQDTYSGGGFFWRISFLMGGEAITLTDLQSERIRSVMQSDPSIHFARVGAAKGFLPLRSEAYVSDRLKSQLAEVVQIALKTDYIAKRVGDELLLSEIFKWYKSDFVKPEDWIKRHAPALVAKKTTVRFIPFDWSLNGSCP